MLAKDIKPGGIFNHNGAPCIIENVTVQSPSARGGATFYKYRARNLITKQKVDITLRGGESLDEADFVRHPVKYMYNDVSTYYFLDQGSFETYTLAADQVADEAPFLTEDLEGIQALIYNEQCVGIQVPVAVVLKVTQCDPSMRSASATARTKPATLETGLVVQVPEYLEQGERIKVDTRSSEFLGRA